MKHLHKRLISLLMVFVMGISFSMNAFAVDENDKQAKEQEIDALEQEKEEQNAALEGMQIDKANTEAEIEALDVELNALQV